MSLLSEAKPAALTEALREAEGVLALPVISGELGAWARRADAELRRLIEAWSGDEPAREERLESIVRDDIELAQRVRRLRERQSALTREVEDLATATSLLVDARGWQPIARAEETRERALIWVVRARAFGTELEAWRREALYRDRGTVD